MVLGIAPVEISDCQIPFEYTITSRSTDVVVMAHPAQNINHSALRSMFEREKLSENNFNDWFRQLKLVLRVEKKMNVIEQPLPVALAADSAPMEGKPVAEYVLEMKGYVNQLERFGYVIPQDLVVGLILNGLNKDFAGFVRNYNMHNMGKMIGELHAMLIEYENGLPKKAETPQVMMIKEHPAKDDTFYHCKEVGHWKRKCPIYLAELLKKKKQVGSASSSDNCHYAPSITRGVVLVHRLLQQEGLLKSTDDESFDQCVSCLSGKMTMNSFPHRLERATDLLGIIHTDVCGPLRHVLRQGASYFITFTDDYSCYGYVYLLKHKHEVFETFKVFKNEVENQPGRTIKALRSYQGGEYISQEFKDYLKACGIVQQFTPP
uniref:Retrotransposon protein, putative, Ty1-copia subclass n=1 Tax=Tanacetum cinerariifolium TaxID=118510 RepID=A0A6L2NZD1_TANCI|nr:retrotransposon protein, putative, Ty1-copia subclass [Tanacetum cinerariifolium]